MFEKKKSIYEINKARFEQQISHLGAILDYLINVKEAKRSSDRFIVFGRARSGTTVLMSMLNDTP